VSTLPDPVVHGPDLCFGYSRESLASLLADPQLLTVIGFGNQAPSHEDPRYLRVGLQPFGEPAPFEIWRSAGRVEHGREGDLQWSSDGSLLFGALLIDERGVGGITAAARDAYSRLLDFCRTRRYPAPLRFWNYIDAITEGEGDAERYRCFNLGRAQGIDGRLEHYPAATAIGRHDGTRQLQVYWLAARAHGLGIENPRQVSAFRYPRQYGLQPPSFARATLPRSERMPLLISGTASVVGHASAHPGDLDAQLDETLCNLDALVDAARVHRPSLPATLGPGSLVKAYVREQAHLPRVAAVLGERLPAATPLVLLHAEICRRDLLVEIDSCHC
jgi:chorismate lyase / 3-hydroxybenzoate synthase